MGHDPKTCRGQRYSTAKSRYRQRFRHGFQCGHDLNKKQLTWAPLSKVPVAVGSKSVLWPSNKNWPSTAGSPGAKGALWTQASGYGSRHDHGCVHMCVLCFKFCLASCKFFFGGRGHLWVMFVSSLSPQHWSPGPRASRLMYKASSGSCETQLGHHVIVRVTSRQWLLAKLVQCLVKFDI